MSATQRALVLVAAGVLAAGGCSAAGHQTAGHGGAAQRSFAGTAIDVPGVAALNKGKDASTTVVSCASRGNCSAGGYYSRRPGGYAVLGDFPQPPQAYSIVGAHAFVADEVAGTWGSVIPVRFPASMDAVGGWVTTMACAAPGNCSAAGTYQTRTGQRRAFVVSRTRGNWGDALTVPGAAVLVNAVVTAMSCPSPGNCGAAGYYEGSSDQRLIFVFSEENGTWGTVHLVRGLVAAFEYGNHGGITSLSCAAPGSCSAGGSYQVPDPAVPRFDLMRAFVISEVDGIWGAPADVPGIAALKRGGSAKVITVSCSSPGNCVAGGTYSGQGGRYRAFLASEVNETWDNAIQVPGAPALMKAAGGLSFAEVDSVSCTAAGQCSVGGYAGLGAFVISEVAGKWGVARAITLPTPHGQVQVGIMTVSCDSPGNCGAAGRYLADRAMGVFVVRQVDGVWQAARRVPADAILARHRYAVITSVWSDGAGDCAAAGNYPFGGYHHRRGPRKNVTFLQAFVFSEPG